MNRVEAETIVLNKGKYSIHIRGNSEVGRFAISPLSYNKYIELLIWMLRYCFTT